MMDGRKKIEAIIVLIIMAATGAYLIASNHTDRPGMMMAKGDMDVVETAVTAGNFNILAKALEAAGLVEALKGEGPFTVFAPTDEAFEKLPEGTLEELLKPENKEKLTAILKHHVINKSIMLRGRRFKSLNDSRLVLNNLGEVTVNNASIVARNIPASNGVIHVIDRVLRPDDDESRRIAVKIVKTAIDLGVPLYNCDNPKACATVYRSALSDLMGMPNGTFSGESRRWITRMFIAASEMDDAREKAWAFRNILDDILTELAAEEDAEELEEEMVD